MSNHIEINPGEVKIILNNYNGKGKVSFKQLGLNDKDLLVEGGNLRIVFVLNDLSTLNYYQVPTIELSYDKNLSETHWICDFNSEVVSDKLDHHGHSTVILMDRDKFASLQHHHENNLILHGDLPEEVTLSAEKSYIHLFN